MSDDRAVAPPGPERVAVCEPRWVTGPEPVLSLGRGPARHLADVAGPAIVRRGPVVLPVIEDEGLAVIRPSSRVGHREGYPHDPGRRLRAGSRVLGYGIAILVVGWISNRPVRIILVSTFAARTDQGGLDALVATISHLVLGDRGGKRSDCDNIDAF